MSTHQAVVARSGKRMRDAQVMRRASSRPEMISIGKPQRRLARRRKAPAFLDAQRVGSDTAPSRGAFREAPRKPLRAARARSWPARRVLVGREPAAEAHRFP